MEWLVPPRQAPALHLPPATLLIEPLTEPVPLLILNMPRPRLCPCPGDGGDHSALAFLPAPPLHQWGHGLNSKDLLQTALDDPEIDALEADIAWNAQLGSPVMKHAPYSSGLDDMEFESWLILATSRPGINVIKLDFKSIEGVLPSVRLVKRYLDAGTVPKHVEIWLNADILRGPGAGSNSPIPAHEFIDACSQLPNATLSIGWTTGWTPLASLAYGNDHVDEMLSLLVQRRLVMSTQQSSDGTSKVPHITFPIRASLAKPSWAALNRLLKQIPNSSLTLWTGDEGVPWHDLDVQAWPVHQDHFDRLHWDIDKGPKYSRFSLWRLLHYFNLAWQHQRLW